MVSAHFLSHVSSASSALDLIARVEGVMGGGPVIRGTRITVASVKGRVSGGDTVDDLIADYPGIAREAFEAAVSYDDRNAEAHPPSGLTRRDG